MLLYCGSGKDSWKSLGQQGDQISQPSRKSNSNIHWKDWCWSWSSNTLATDAKSQLIGKDPDAGKDWRQKEKGTTEDEMVGWHHWLNARVWANSGRQWRTGKPGVLQSKGSQSDTTEWLNNRWETLLSQLWSREIVCFNLNLRSLESWLKQLSALTLIYTGIPIQAFTDTAALLHEAPYAN